MKILSNEEVNQVFGAYASMNGSFSISSAGATFGNGFYIAVTGTSANILGNFAAYSDKVIDTKTKEVLYDGTQGAFCINGNRFSVSAIEGGHTYSYAGPCN